MMVEDPYRATVYVDGDMWSEIEALAARNGRSKSGEARMAFKRHILLERERARLEQRRSAPRMLLDD